MSGRIRVGLIAGLAVLLGAGCPARIPARPPIVLILIDTLRADRLGCYGHAVATSPRIDELAADGVRFERAYSQAPWTTPSVAALLTSRYPRELGIEHVVSPVPPGPPWLPELLGEAGYATGAVVSHSFVSSKWGFARGFSLFDEQSIAGQRAATSTQVTDRAIEFVDGAQPGPFFLFVHYFDPHFALVEHPELGLPAGDPARRGRVRSPVPFLTFGRSDAGVTEPEAREMLRIYDTEIAYTDREVGRLLDHLRARGLYDDAIVVLTADHGEEFLDHGRLGHTKTLFDELIRVPLLLKAPGLAPGVEAAPVASLDVFPTLLDALGLPGAETLRGRSLLATPDPDRPVFSETQRQGRLEAVVQGSNKLIRQRETGRLWLFDTGRDPAERRDLSAVEPQRVDELAQLLDAWSARYQRRGPAPPPVVIDDAERERLRSLGYGR